FMDNIFIQLAIILGASSVLGFVTHKFKLPLLIAYLLVGLALATLTLFNLKDSEILSFLPEIGMALVLFLVGMELDLREIRRLGKPILLASSMQIIISSIAGFAIAGALGFGRMESIYLGIGLSFSSTIVVIKLLLEKQDLNSLYGKLSVGILLLEDLIAVLILLGLTVSPSFLNFGYQQAFPIITFVFKVILLFGATLLINRFFLPKIFEAISESQELLFLSAIAWCFLYVAFSQFLGFSVVIGAFLAGVGLAASPYHFQIQGKVKPLRDFFVTLFFVYLGTQVNFTDLSLVYPLIIAFSLYAVLIKPVVFLLVLGSFGFRKHTMFQTAVNLSNISEFSLIILLVGLKMGVVGSAALTTIAVSMIVSTVISSLMISKAPKLYKFFKSFVSFFERDRPYQLVGEENHWDLKDHVIVVGSHQVGESLVKYFQKEEVPLIVLDFNPYQVEKLHDAKIPVVFGDMGDPEVLESLNLNEAKMLISTVPNVTDNKLLIEEVKDRKLGIPVIVRSDSYHEARDLYKFGASFVFVPDIVSGEYLVEMLKNHINDKDYFKERPKIEMEKLDKKTLAWE
ncbi:cation:proton antiporter, partial [Candidatus Daviesbacteria bacterium]|nr:cation:proton antiporter [Candidatus Daviesbacteria bacterium]